MKRITMPNLLRCIFIFLALTATTAVSHAQSWKLYAVTGQQTSTNLIGNGPEFQWPDHTLFEVNTATAALTELFELPWVNDSQAIGFNPENNLIYHTGGAEAYSNSPDRVGHDQGGPDVEGVGYQDSQYMGTVDPVT